MSQKSGIDPSRQAAETSSTADASAQEPRKPRFMDYAKQNIWSLLAASAAFIAGEMASNLASRKNWLPSGKTKERLQELFIIRDDKWNAFTIGNLIAAPAFFLVNYTYWGRREKRQRGIQNIHQEVYSVASPDALENRLERNSHIQDGIQKIIASGPQANHAGTVADKSAQEPTRTM